MLLKLIKTAIFSFILVFSLNSPVMAATQVWLEDFNSYVDGTINGSADDIWGNPIAWSTTGITADSNTWFAVQTYKIDPSEVEIGFEGRDLDGQGIWETELIPISGYLGVGISVDVSAKVSFDQDDYLRFYYFIDDGNEDTYDDFIMFAEFIGNIDSPTTASVSGLEGVSLAIRIEALNNQASERYRFDNVLVTAETVPVPTSILLFGSGIVGLIGFRRKTRQ